MCEHTNNHYCERCAAELAPGTVCILGKHHLVDSDRFTQYLESQNDRRRPCSICGKPAGRIASPVSGVWTRGVLVGDVCTEHNTIEQRGIVVDAGRKRLKRLDAGIT